jgi:hypothetical protein
MEHDVLDDSVALVEDSEDRDALRHRRDSALPGGGRRDLLAGRRRILLLRAAPTPRQGDQRQPDQQRCERPHHAYSGIHGS